MNWLSLATGLISIVRSLISFLHDRKLIEQGERDAALKGLQDANEAIAKANAAREAARLAAARDPDSIMRPDEHTRKD